MKKNMGSIDRVIRLLAAVAVGILYFTDQISGTAVIILGIIAVAFLVTGAIGFCPMYLPLKFSTLKRKNVEN